MRGVGATTKERIELYRRARKLPPEILEAFTLTQQNAEHLVHYAETITKMPFRETRLGGGAIPFA